MEVGGIGKDKGAGEEETDGENRAHEHLLRHVYIFDTVEEMGRPL